MHNSPFTGAFNIILFLIPTKYMYYYSGILTTCPSVFLA